MLSTTGNRWILTSDQNFFSMTIAKKTFSALPVVAVAVLMLNVIDSVMDYLLRHVRV